LVKRTIQKRSPRLNGGYSSIPPPNQSVWKMKGLGRRGFLLGGEDDFLGDIHRKQNHSGGTTGCKKMDGEWKYQFRLGRTLGVP